MPSSTASTTRSRVPLLVTTLLLLPGVLLALPAPADATAHDTVTLKAYQVASNGVRGSELQELRVPRTTLGNLGTVTVDLEITGASPADVPLAAHFGAGNLTVSGNVLPVRATDIGVVGATGPGIVRITLTPTRAPGSVQFDVDWKGHRTTHAIPITTGAQLATESATLPVLTDTTFTVTVRDARGNPNPSASVVLLTRAGTMDYPGASERFIQGTGEEGRGLDGRYTFTVHPTTLGEIVVYAQIGAILFGVDNLNYTYASLQVVPLHSAATTLSRNTSLAGDRTPVVLNVTGNGAPLTTPDTYNVYFLTEAQASALRDSGRSALAGLTYPQTLVGASSVNLEVGGHAPEGVHLNVTLAPGAYRVFVCASSTLVPAATCEGSRWDNLDAMPAFTAVSWTVTFDQPWIPENATAGVPVHARIVGTDGNPAPLGSLVRIRSGASHLANAIGTFALNETGAFSFSAVGAAPGDIVFEVDIAGHPAFFTAVTPALRVGAPPVDPNNGNDPGTNDEDSTGEDAATKGAFADVTAPIVVGVLTFLVAAAAIGYVLFRRR